MVQKKNLKNNYNGYLTVFKLFWIISHTVKSAYSRIASAK